MNIRVGVNFFTISIDGESNAEGESLAYDVQNKLFSVSALLDYYIYKSIHATAFTFWNTNMDPAFPVSMGDETLNLTIQDLKLTAKAEVAK